MGKDFIAALIPYRVFKNGAVTYHLGGKETPPLQVWAQEKLTGLTLFKVNPALLSGTSPAIAASTTLRRGARLAFTNSENEPTLGHLRGHGTLHRGHQLSVASHPRSIPQTGCTPDRPAVL